MIPFPVTTAFCHYKSSSGKLTVEKSTEDTRWQKELRILAVRQEQSIPNTEDQLQHCMGSSIDVTKHWVLFLGPEILILTLLFCVNIHWSDISVPTGTACVEKKD